MDIKDILAEQDLSKRIGYLKSQRQSDPEVIEYAKKQIDPYQHDVFNTAKRPYDKKIEYYKDENGEEKSRETLKDVNRLALPLQKIIVERAVAFLFGNPVVVSSNSDDTEDIINAIKKIDKSNKIDSFNRRLARVLFTATEVAEHIFTVGADKEDRYGFESDLKFKSQIFSPLNGDVLYPFFNDYGDLIAFSRAFIKKDIEGKEIEYFETWTDESYTRLVKNQSWAVDENKPNALKKIPIVYARQPHTEWYYVQSLIDRIEKLLSNNADINDRHSSPILVAHGTVQTKINDFVQISENGKLEYIERPGGADIIKNELDVLLNLVYSLSQTPDISFSRMQGLGNALSGEGFKMLLVDAHLKVQNKMEIFDEYLTRRYNIVKSILSMMNPTWKDAISKMEVDIKVTPYTINSESAIIDNIGRSIDAGIMSEETGVSLNPLIEDSLTEIERIKAEKEIKETDPNGLDDIMNE